MWVFQLTRNFIMSRGLLATYNKCAVRPSQFWSFHTSAAAATDLTKLFIGKIHTAYYARYRPSYSAPVLETIIKFYKETLSDFRLAVDVGCGSGQGTVPLASYFEKVVGLDVSEQQVRHAPRDIANLSFDVSPAEDLSRFESQSVDLITVAEAVHWFNLDKFFSEVTRVLKPGGSLAVYGYTAPSLCLPAADAYFRDMHAEVSRDWPGERGPLFNDYMEIDLPFPRCRRDKVFMQKHWTINDLIGFAAAWCPPDYFETGQRHDVQRDVEKKLKSLYNDGGDRRIKVTFPVFMLMGHKPE